MDADFDFSRVEVDLVNDVHLLDINPETLTIAKLRSILGEHRVAYTQGPRRKSSFVQGFRMLQNVIQEALRNAEPDDVWNFDEEDEEEEEMVVQKVPTVRKDRKKKRMPVVTPLKSEQSFESTPEGMRVRYTKPEVVAYGPDHSITDESDTSFWATRLTSVASPVSPYMPREVSVARECGMVPPREMKRNLAKTFACFCVIVAFVAFAGWIVLHPGRIPFCGETLVENCVPCPVDATCSRWRFSCAKGYAKIYDGCFAKDDERMESYEYAKKVKRLLVKHNMRGLVDQNLMFGMTEGEICDALPDNCEQNLRNAQDLWFDHLKVASKQTRAGTTIFATTTGTAETFMPLLFVVMFGAIAVLFYNMKQD